MQLLKFVSKLTILLIIAFQLGFISEATAGIKDKVGGSGGSSTSSSVESDSNSMSTILYVAAGVAVAYVVWQYFNEKAEKEAAEEQDSTEAVLMKPLQDCSNRPETCMQKIEEIMPVNIEFGLSKTFYNDKRYLVGVRVKL